MRCATCGTRLWHEPQAFPVVTTAAGTLDDPSWVVPAIHIWVEKASPAAIMQDDAVKIEGQPDRAEADRCVQQAVRGRLKLGTPLSPAAIKVMLLGSGELGKEVVIELQRLGVETIAVDRYADAPAQQVAHRAHVIDMTDAEALRALVEQERPHLLVPEIEAMATDELVRIEADGLATVIPTARAAHLTMNRERIRGAGGGRAGAADFALCLRLLAGGIAGGVRRASAFPVSSSR